MVSFIVIPLFLSVLLGSRNVSEAEITHFSIKNEVERLTGTLQRVLIFCEDHYYEINFDGLLGIVLAQANLEMLNSEIEGNNLDFLTDLLMKVDIVGRKILDNLRINNHRYLLFKHFLLQPSFWLNDVAIKRGNLKDYGVYNSKDFQVIYHHLTTNYDGLTSDVCLEEILRNAPKKIFPRHCSVSRGCKEMMFGDRNDTAYLLTHRLLYIQIARASGCLMKEKEQTDFIRDLCSLMLKEAKSNEIFGFPQQDIFLEQVTLCGMEGFAEFLNSRWRKKIIEWQDSNGCYRNRGDTKLLFRIVSRSENSISFGCSDHTTGLAAAALALNLRNLLTSGLNLNM